MRVRFREYIWRFVLIAPCFLFSPVCVSASESPAAVVNNEAADKDKAVTDGSETKADAHKLVSPNSTPALESDKVNGKTVDGSAAKKDKQESAGRLDLNPSNVNKIIEGDEIYGEQFRVSSMVQGDVVTVQTWLNSRSDNLEHDSKIDAVLIAKKLLDAFPQHNPTVKLRYFDRQDHHKYFEITIMPGVVKSYAAGVMPEKDLLGTLSMIPGSTEPNAAAAGTSEVQTSLAPIDPAKMTGVWPGYRYEERGRLFQRMKWLEQRGVKASLVRTLVAEMETASRDGENAKVDVMLARLNRAVNDMEENYKKAQTIKIVPVAMNASGSKGAERNSSLPSDVAELAMASDMHKIYGEFYPEYGPAYPDRVCFADKLKSMKKNHLSYDKLLVKFKQVEAMAAQNDFRLDTGIQQMYQELHMKPIIRDAEYQQNQKLADLLKSRMSKAK